MNNPLVSIACITYNQEKYIRDAIEGFLAQKTNFPIEIIIHDDASTDNTAEIIREYAKEHLELIKPIYQKENQYSKGLTRISINFVWPKCSGKYIATCEGDDYWTDPYKLQKQVDFLDSHPECSVCFHNVNILSEDGKKSHPFHSKKLKPILKLKDLLEQNFIPTCSQMFRNNLSYEFLEPFCSHVFGDWPLNILNAQHGDIGYLDTTMGVYRIHSRGIWSSKYATPEGRIKMLESEIEFYKIINKLLKYKYNRIIKAKILVRLLEKYKEQGKRMLRLSFPNVYKLCHRIKTIGSKP